MGKMMVVVKARTRIREECRHENESGEIFKMRDQGGVAACFEGKFSLKAPNGNTNLPPDNIEA